jgi:lambda family phage tail tape measure protein
MANDRFVLEFSLKDVGETLKQGNKDANAFRGTLEAIQKLTNAPGSKAKNSAFGGAMGSSEYDRARGTTGQTGASGRDFANQARGLDGLVRLYATYAANLFAVSAGFRALSDAMDTTNMIQGLNQLGAQSGIAMGTLAKNFAATTDGAISMREAMEATVKGTTAGLSSKQLMQLGNVANSASKALGVNMSDAVSRLTRGITKLEPELLDELGIFTKVGKATQEYARSVGKAEAQLTDFEKRQAFANAVLQEGTDKFGAISLQANPYDKLTAGLKDLAQNGLEKVNKLLTPLISGLASSPTALTAAIGYLGATIVRQALPAIGQYKEALREGAEQAKVGAAQRAQMAKEAYEASKSKKESELDVAAEKAKKAKDAAAAELAAVRESGFTRSSQAYKTMLKDADKVTTQEIDHLKKLEEQYKKQGKMDIASRYENAISKILASAKAERAYTTAVEATNQVLHSQGNIWTALGRAQLMAARARDISTQKTLVSQAAVDTQTVGPIAAFAQLNKDVSKSDLGPIRSQWTRLTGTITIATTAAVGFISAIQNMLLIVTAIVVGFKLFDTWISKNKEQTEKFNKSVDTNTTALKAYDDAISAIAKKDPSVIFASDSLTAQANAALTLTDALTDLRENYEKLSKVTSSSAWDTFTNKISKFWGGDTDTKFAENAASNIAKQIAGMTSEVDRAAAKALVNAELGTKRSTEFDWMYAIKEQGPKSAASLEKIEKGLKKVATEAANTASRSKEFDDALKQVNLSYRDFSTSITDKSPLTKLGNDMLTLGVKMSGALKDPTAAIANMLGLLKDTTTLGIFAPDSVATIQALQPKLDQLNTTQGELQQKLLQGRQELNKLESDYQKERAIGNTPAGQAGGVLDNSKNIAAAKAALAAEQRKMAELVSKETANKKEIARIMEDPVFADLTIQSFKTGADLVQQSIKRGFDQAGIDLRKGIISTLGSIPGTAALESDANQRSIALQQQVLKTQNDMIRAQGLATAATIANTAALEALTITQELATTPKTAQGLADWQQKKAASDKFQEISEQFNEMQLSKSKVSPAQFIDMATKAMEQFGKKAPAFNSAMVQMIGQAERLLGVRLEEKKLGVQSQLDILNRDLKIMDEQKAVKQSNLALDRNGVEIANQYLTLLGSQNGSLKDYEITLQQSYQNSLAQYDLDASLLDISTERAKIARSLKELAGVANKEDEVKKLNQADILLKNREQIAQDKNKLQLAQNEVAAKIQLNKTIAEEATRRLNIKSIIQDTANIRASGSLDLDKLELDYQIKNLSLSDQQIADKKYQIELSSIQIDQVQRLASVDLKYQQDKIRLEERRRNAAAGAAGDKARADVDEEMRALTDRMNAELYTINAISQAKRKAADQDAQYTERQKAYGKVFEDTFQGMSDIFIEFAKNGKASFKSLIDSMIEGLIRYELQQQMTMAYAASKPFFMNLIGSVFGFNTGSTYGASGAMEEHVFNPFKSAKGSVYDTGLKTFAKGGMFTNSVVNQPTLFKFAQGTGLMGEAGPEAIMPLKRDSNGNLGVRSNNQSQKVDVVVNNFGSEKATTKETTDSQGNRKIEVIIGEMVSQEVTRTGSPTQQAFSNTFGTRPVLARR